MKAHELIIVAVLAACVTKNGASKYWLLLDRNALVRINYSSSVRLFV